MPDRLQHSAIAQGLSAAGVEQLMCAICAETFDPSVGTRLGADLADAGQPASEVFGLAEGLLPLADLCDHPRAWQRLASLLVALGRGYQHRLEHPRGTRRAELPHERFHMIFDHSGIAIAIGDTQGQILDVNQALADMIGVPIDSLRGISVYDFAPPEDRGEIRAQVYDNLVSARSGAVKLERGLLSTDGSRRRLAFTITFIAGETSAGDYLLAVGEDVTDRHELRHQAHHDHLTGLPNRRRFLAELGEIIATQQPATNARVGLCFIDLDYFKKVNDTYGHGAGDRVLTEVAGRLGARAHASGCSLSRIGGDEFVVLVPPPVSEPQLVEIADSLCQALDEPILVAGIGIPISASIGIVTAPLLTSTAESVLDAADAALRRAKATGRRRWVLGDRLSVSPAPEANHCRRYTVGHG